MQEFKGGCHCGAVRFSYRGEAITKGVRCNCSICSRKGYMMSAQPLPASELHIEADEGVLGLYQFGEKTAKHYFCKHCGINPFHETATKAGHYRVNLACIDGVDVFTLECEVLDGANLL